MQVAETMPPPALSALTTKVLGMLGAYIARSPAALLKVLQWQRWRLLYARANAANGSAEAEAANNLEYEVCFVCTVHSKMFLAVAMQWCSCVLYKRSVAMHSASTVFHVHMLHWGQMPFVNECPRDC